MIDEDGLEYPENYLDLKEYRENAAKLLEQIANRDELAALLKIAHPAKISELKKIINRLDNSIEGIENILELHRKAHEIKLKYLKDLEDLTVLSEQIDIELRKKVADNEPEKLEILDAMLSGDERNH